MIFEACRGPDRADKAAQAEVLTRYCGAIYRYALRILGHPDLAQEACQEFAYRFVRGDFRHADPAKGRFRDYVKTAVFHLLGEFQRERKARATTMRFNDKTAAAPLTPPPIEADHAEFLALWRRELLDRAWREMELERQPTGPPYYEALRINASAPELGAEELADRLKAAGHGDYKPVAIRQVLHRSREIFAEKLLAGVSRSIFSNSRSELAEELADLDLLTYCREALKRRQN